MKRDPSREYKVKVAVSHRTLGRDLSLIIVSNFLGSFGDGLYAYLLPVYMTKTLGASSVEIGALYAVVNLIAASTLLISGILADRYDLKKVLVVGWCIWVPVPIIFALATNWPETIPGMILWGSWLGGPSVAAYVVRAAEKDKLTFAFTAMSAGWSLGYIFSPALGGYLAAVVGMRIVFFMASMLYASAGIMLLFITSQRPSSPGPYHSEEGYSILQLLRKRQVLALSILFSSTMFTMMLFRPFIPRFLSDVYGYSEVKIGILGSILFFGSSVLGIMLGRLGDMWRKSYAVSTVLALCSVSLVLLMMFGEFYVLMIAVFLGGCSYTVWSLMNAIITPLGPESAKARWVSVPQSISMFTSTLAPYIGGVLYEHSPQYPFMLAIVIMILLASVIVVGIFDKIACV